MIINPGLSVVPTGQHSVQIGSGSRSVHLHGCSTGVLKLIDLLRFGIVDGEETPVGRQHGLSIQQTWDLLNRLAPVLVSFPLEQGPPTSAAHWEPYRDEVSVSQASLNALGLHSDEHGVNVHTLDENAVVIQRRAITVQVLGLGRTGAHVVLGLAAGGVGQLVAWDAHTVSRPDLGLGYVDSDVGRLRSVALSRRMEQRGHHGIMIPITHPLRPQPAGDLSIIVTKGGWDLNFLALAQADEHPVLPVVLRDDDALVGPWSLNAVTPCPLCWERTWEDLDPHYAARTEALHVQAAGAESVGLAVTVAGLVCMQLFNWVDSQEIGYTTATQAPAGISPGMILRVDAATGAVQTLTTAPHQSCGCGKPSQRQLRPA